MMPAATHFDPVIGIDIHLVQPSGPVPPLPIPHPYIGIVFDPFDYLPIIGSTVKINGMHRAIAGTAGKTLPKHFPIGGTFVPPLPANEHENFMGSSTVEMDGDAAAYMALPCLSCQSIGMPPPPRQNPKKKTKVRSLVLPTSLVLPIPKGAPVLIGGSPTISLFSLAARLVGPLAKAIGKAKAFRKAAGAFRKARRRGFRNMKPGFLKCKVLRAEPVDVVTGEVVVDQQDFELPGRIPIRWTRHHRAGSARRGICGVGWETPADARLELQVDGGVVFHNGTGVATYFDALPDAEPVMEPVDGGRLYRLDRHYAVEPKGGLTYYFELPAAPAGEIPVAAIVDRCRNSLHFVRDRDGLREVVESAGRRLVCTSEQGLLRSIALHHPDFPERRTLVRFAYDGDDNLTAVYDALDHPYTFGQDDRHRLVRHTNRTGLSFYYEYDAESRCVHSWGDGGLYDYRFEYDPVGRFTNLTDSLGHPWTVEYDERLQITRETDPLGGVTSYAYDEAGRTTAVTDALGRTTQYVYDQRGDLLALVRPDGKRLEWGYDRNGKPMRHVDANGQAWKMTGDPRGLLRQWISPRGGEWTDWYNEAGDLVAVKDAVGAETRFSYDRLGLVREIADGLGNTQHFALDPLGKVASYIDGEGFETTYVHDAKGRLTSVRSPSGYLTSYTFDPDDNLVSLTNRNGQTTTFRYFGQGEIAERHQANGTVVRYQYDTEERLTSVVNEIGTAYELRWDPLGRIVAEIDFWGNAKCHEYDRAGNVVATKDALGRLIRLEYDALDRLTRRAFEDGTEESFQYDANGNLTAAENATIRIEHAYDADGNMVEERQGDFVLTHNYDLLGNRTERASSNGRKVAFAFDAAGRASEIRLDGKMLAQMRYDRRSLVTHEALGPHLKRDYEYDSEGMVARQVLWKGDTPLVDRRYTRDPIGNVLMRETVRAGSRHAIAYHYDPMERIIRSIDTDGTGERFDYAATGDLLQPVSQDSSGTRRSDYDGMSYIFDPAGNLIRRRGPHGDATFEWDPLNRLIGAVSENGQKIRYSYDALGRRVSKQVDGEEVAFRWDGDHLALEIRHTKSFDYINRCYTFEPLCRICDQVEHFNTDPIGAPSEIIRSDGSLQWSGYFTATGRMIDEINDGVENNHGFQGQYFDREINLFYNRYRYFDGRICGFISIDPVGLYAGHSIYRYAPNVWRWVDPLGLSCRSSCRLSCRQVSYGIGDLAEAVIAERRKLNNWQARGTNFAAAKVKNRYGEETIITAARNDSDMHAEEFALADVHAQLKDGDTVVEIYTERHPCPDRCEGLISWKFPGAQVKYTYPYERGRKREALNDLQKQLDKLRGD
jgi:RHS repeat-associated protein